MKNRCCFSLIESDLDIRLMLEHFTLDSHNHLKIGTLSEPTLFENQIHVMENTSEIDSCFKKKILHGH